MIRWLKKNSEVPSGTFRVIPGFDWAGHPSFDVEERVGECWQWRGLDFKTQLEAGLFVLEYKRQSIEEQKKKKAHLSIRPIYFYEEERV